MDPMLSLSLTLHANKGCYALLLGSGLSSAAGIPTGWQIVQDLIGKIAHLQGEAPTNPEYWYAEKFGSPPEYSKLIQSIASTKADRQQLLRQYFEPLPAPDGTEVSQKIPTNAHRSIAELAKLGIIKVIVTTNFDRLLERALEAEGITPVVIATPDAVEGALPLVHARFTVIKVNGDYMDSRIKNSKEELAVYDDKMNMLLERVFDEYGLIVCGWSGEWDTALRDSIERIKGRRFATYWSSRNEPSEKAKDLIRIRSAIRIDNKDANLFFREILEKVKSLNDISQQHPITTQVAVASLKRFIVNPQDRIRLNDLMRKEVEDAYHKIEDYFVSISQSAQPLEEEIQNFCISHLSTVIPLMIHGCFWGETNHRVQWQQTIEKFAALHAVKKKIDRALLDFPATCLLYVGGIACVLSDQWGTLAHIIQKSEIRYRADERVLVTRNWFENTANFDQSFRFNAFGPNNPSRELFQKLVNFFSDVEPEQAKYETAFNLFECIIGMHEIYRLMTSGGWQYTLKGLGNAERYNTIFHRFNWWRTRKPVKEQIQQNTDKSNPWGPVGAGLFDGDNSKLLELLSWIDPREEAATSD
jgi:hypothetical protein